MKFDLGGIGKGTDYMTVNLSGCPDIKADILDLDSFCEDNKVDEFYMSHTYEHISIVETPNFLSKIIRKLKSGGLLKIVFTNSRCILDLYSKGILDFRCVRDLFFTSYSRRIKCYQETGLDLQSHKYMWGEEDLQEELIFYGFSRTEIFNAGSWPFDFENYLPGDNMHKYHGILIPNLGVTAYK